MASTVWRGYISFGLISIPVRLFRAARAEKVNFRRLYRSASALSEFETKQHQKEQLSAESQSAGSAGSSLAPKRAQTALEEPREIVPEPALEPVQHVSVRKGTDEVLPGTSVVKGYEYENGRYVVVEPEELKSIAAQTSSAMEIQEFVELGQIDPVYFETSYYVIPEEAGEKAYALLYRSLQLTGLVAIAQFAMHNRDHVVVLRPGRTGILVHTMFYASEVRADEEYRTDTTEVTGKELELAKTLIHSLAAPFEASKYRDAYRERLESLLARKVQGQPVALAPKLQSQANIVDIADALRRSLAELKKPAMSEKAPQKTSGRSKKA